MARRKREVSELSPAEYSALRAETRRRRDDRLGDVSAVRTTAPWIGFPAGLDGVFYYEEACGWAVPTIVFENGYKTTWDADVDAILEPLGPLEDLAALEAIARSVESSYFSRKRNPGA